MRKAVPFCTCAQELVRLCGLRRDPSQPPLDPLPMVAAVNGVTNNAFQPQVPECALEFLGAVLDNLELLPQFLQSYQEVGDCVFCQAPYRQVCTILKRLAVPETLCPGLHLPPPLGDRAGAPPAGQAACRSPPAPHGRGRRRGCSPRPRASRPLQPHLQQGGPRQALPGPGRPYQTGASAR